MKMRKTTATMMRTPHRPLRRLTGEYQKLKNEYDSEKTHDNPRLTNNTVLSLCYTEWCPELLLKARFKMVNNNKCNNPFISLLYLLSFLDLT